MYHIPDAVDVNGVRAMIDHLRHRSVDAQPHTTTTTCDDVQGVTRSEDATKRASRV
jgi:hypothetical protein